ncbi:hypothetical protein BKP56_02370 [Marinilactibacillus sp. 15R]|uniref:hypothetical protein n=1 Tax=Marinilactibacillus sp. 15R TaxID=1911586 RepID=UPI00090B63A2|nr:hypothetical protein [Marinilactibacillus sp. 15R]API88214.1 hypothetical protein BKP56_02370 [Marinilactibacillus sp. 15R]
MNTSFKLKQFNSNKESLSPNLQNQLSSILSKLHSNCYRQIIAASKDKSTIGLALSWENPFHPHADYLKVYLDESAQETNALQKQLLTQLEQNATSSSDRFIYSLMNDQYNIISLLESSGYELIRKTYEPTLAIDDCLIHITEPSHSTVLTYKEALSNSSLKVELFHLLKRNYVNTHQVNPAADLTLSEWESLFLHEQPDLDLSLIGLTNGSISSYITVFSSDQNSVEIAWVGLDEETPISYLELKQLFKKQLELFKSKGVNSIETEIDTTDYYACGLFSFIKLTELESFHTYRKMI